MVTRLEFFMRLREGLSRLPAEEVENAVRYYTEYFDDAGPESEGRVLQELGDPMKIAQQIIAESMVRDIVSAPPPKAEQPPKEAKPKSGLSAVWTVILAVFAAPIALPLAIAIAAVAFALVVVAAALVLSFFAVSIGLMVGGVFGFFVGCATLGVHVPTGLCAIGAGIALAGVGLLLFLPVLWFAKATFTGIARLIGRHVFRKGASN